MIKAVVFDMDGVLIDAKEWHYDALNRALRLFGTEISRADHLTTFDGLPTKRKLELLSTTENLPGALHGFLNELKQIYTMEIVSVRCKPVFMHEMALSALKSRGVKLAVASNSIRPTVEAMMSRARLTKYLDLMLSNQDVSRAKPDPEIYTLAMQRLGTSPDETLIVEDNEHGIRAARASGAHVLVVKSVQDVNIANIDSRIAAIHGGAA
ncbi:HAD family hydrolase [Methylobacterium sp. J-068]|uniref:HAD family hydrolase n=1 Tax=Methylobacterium sp. J-068 TaxID=2836649 RepID=UPI001FB89A4A|nr:HAD family phosphatase [Methylobacterium sp. J-068]MCJ2033219.1 HAD family phosphatase [Methylobacterium sp. J-068]